MPPRSSSSQPSTSLLVGRTVASSMLDNGAGQNTGNVSTDLVEVYRVCGLFSIHHNMDKRLEYALKTQNREMRRGVKER